jgi:hypothetical protein
MPVVQYIPKDTTPVPGKKGDRGKDGVDGRSVELQTGNGYIRWRLVGATTWINLIPISQLKGDKPVAGVDYTNGYDGKNIELQNSGGWIWWRNVGDDHWNELILVSSLKGQDGYTPRKGIDYNDGADSTVPGPAGPSGKDGKDGITPIKGKDYFDGKDGKDGSKGDKGDPLTFDVLTVQQKDQLKGEQGLKGDKGDTTYVGSVDGGSSNSTYQVIVQGGIASSF